MKHLCICVWVRDCDKKLLMCVLSLMLPAAECLSVRPSVTCNTFNHFYLHKIRIRHKRRRKKEAVHFRPILTLFCRVSVNVIRSRLIRVSQKHLGKRKTVTLLLTETSSFKQISSSLSNNTPNWSLSKESWRSRKMFSPSWKSPLFPPLLPRRKLTI